MFTPRRHDVGSLLSFLLLDRSRILWDWFDEIMPRLCAGCGAVGGESICGSCVAAIRTVPDVLCSCCGVPFESPPERLCERCTRRAPAFGRLRAAALYSNDPGRAGALARSVRSFKYSGRRDVARPLADLVLARYPFVAGEHDVVLAVPLHLSRLRERGYNQSLLLARRIARAQGIPILGRALRRSRATATQAGHDRAARLRNVREAFLVTDRKSVAGRRVLLVDDVATSGATADACARALLGAGAHSVDVLVVARTPRD